MKNITIGIIIFISAFVGTSLVIAATRIPNPNKVVEPVTMFIAPGTHFRQCVAGWCICHKYNGATTTIAIHKIYYDLHTQWEPTQCLSEDDKFFTAKGGSVEEH